ncbi:MAG: glycosyltransferase family 2 protein [Bacillota bacterium]
MRTAAIIPAYNEQETLRGVVDVLKGVPIIEEIIVVSDGSTDRTPEVAREAGVRLVELTENRGKGAAMKEGLRSTSAEVVLFLDADLIGLTTDHVYALLNPVLSGACQMSVGVFEGGRVATDLAQVVAPYLSGQRALKAGILADIDDLEVMRFGAEIALTRHCKRSGIEISEVSLAGLTHRMKEEKMGLSRGLAARFRMYWEIVRSVQKGL